MNKKSLLLILSTMLLLSACNSTQTRAINITQVSNLGEQSVEECLDMFLAGDIMAFYPNAEGKPFYITELSIDEEDALSYSIGDRVDLDNDGELELILNGAYGGKYFDVREGQIFVLDEGWGTAGILSYTYFDDQTWIVHSDTTHVGRYIYDFTLYDGSGNIADTFQLTQEFWENPDMPDGPDTLYTYRGESITRAEFMILREEMLQIGERMSPAEID